MTNTLTACRDSRLVVEQNVSELDFRKILTDLYGQDQPITKFAKDIGRSKQTVYKWLSGKLRMPKLAKKYLIMKLTEKNQEDKTGCAGKG